MKHITLLVLLAGLVGCNKQKRSTDQKNPKAPVTQSVPATAAPTESCPATVRRFLEWYYRSQERLTTSTVLNYPQAVAAAFEVPPARISKTGHYELNKPGLAYYIGVLDSTGFFSEAFLTRKRQN